MDGWMDVAGTAAGILFTLIMVPYFFSSLQDRFPLEYSIFENSDTNLKNHDWHDSPAAADILNAYGRCWLWNC